MTLVGLLPPLCDNGNMLVDGGYSECLASSNSADLYSWHLRLVDNLPVRLSLLHSMIHLMLIP